MRLPPVAAALVLSAATAASAEASHKRITFKLTDEPGRWFKNTAGPIAGTWSLAGVMAYVDGKPVHMVNPEVLERRSSP